MLTQTVRLLSLSGTGEERLQNARKWEYVLFFFFLFQSHSLSGPDIQIDVFHSFTLTLLTH